MKSHCGRVYNRSGRRGSRRDLAARLLAAALLLASARCDGDVEYLQPATDSIFQPGQVWTYHTRPGEAGSLFVVGAVDRVPGLGRVVHITVTGVRFRTPKVAGGFANEIAHLAVEEDALLESVERQVDAPGIDRSGFEAGYQNWLDAYEAGKRFVQKVPLAQALDQVETSQNE